MKLQYTLAVLCTMSMAACSGNPTSVNSDAPVDNTTTASADIVSNAAAKVTVGGDNMATRVAYDAATDEMIVEAIPFDDDAFEGRYQRAAALDRGGYLAYTSTRGFDTYVAYYDTSSTGNVNAMVVNSGEYADHGFSGASFERTGTVSLPTTTQRAIFTGNYVGMRTISTRGGMDTITGTARIEADFSDDTVRGSITNRTIAAVDARRGGTGETNVGMPITLANTSINRTNASFTGTAGEVDGGLGMTGTYEGVFGGPEATEVAGVVIITGGDLREIGTFISEQ